VASFWADDQINDGEFAEALEFLIQEGVINIESVRINEVTLSDEAERLYQLEIAQKEDRITILENEVEDTGLDNSILLQTIVENNRIIELYTMNHNNLLNEFRNYKIEYPPVKDIGGLKGLSDKELDLQRTIREYQRLVESLDEKYDNLVQEFEEFKIQNSNSTQT